RDKGTRHRVDPCLRSPRILVRARRITRHCALSLSPSGETAVSVVDAGRLQALGVSAAETRDRQHHVHSSAGGTRGFPPKDCRRRPSISGSQQWRCQRRCQREVQRGPPAYRGRRRRQQQQPPAAAAATKEATSHRGRR
ncbi:unnamed protein product, partial [Scytosiphon promiscuus]